MNGQPSDNPYAAPQTELQRSDLPEALLAYPNVAPAAVSANLGAVWVTVFCLNLPVGILLGMPLCRGLGWLGVLLGITGWLSLTIYLFRHSGDFAKYWLGGAICVGLSQFLPYLHLILGIVAVGMFNRPNDELDFIAALICTIVVGGGLLAVSLLLGALFYGVYLGTKSDA
jgi:hypothetical protein